MYYGWIQAILIRRRRDREYRSSTRQIYYVLFFKIDPIHCFYN